MRHDPSCESRLPEAQDRLFMHAARLAKLGAWECEIASERLIWTDGVYDLFGLPVGSRLKRSLVVGHYFDESRDRMEFLRAEAIKTGQGFAMDAQIRTDRGEDRWIRLSVDVARESGRLVRIFGAKQDITNQIKALARLQQLAEHDALTGLANRGMFEARYQGVIKDELHHGFVSALALIDIDHFKAINDGFGHSAGDACLREVATRLKRVFGDAVLVARIGGDEFAVLVRAPLSPVRIAQMLQRALIALRKPLLWNRKRIELSVSIGATILAQPHRRKLSELFAEADAALYAAKDAGRDASHIFGEAMLQRSAQSVAAKGVASCADNLFAPKTVGAP